MTETLTRPELTMPREEAVLVRGLYGQAECILEYGSGGSTVMASEMLGKTVYSVESDRDWADKMREWFVQNPPRYGTQIEIVWADIGETRDWGHPVDHSAWDRFPRYPLGVWHSHKPEPDVVLVDGRFRIGCALAAAYMTEKPITILIDDFAKRAAYHKVQDYLGPAKIIGRMARFDVTPQPIPKERLLNITQFMYRPL